MGPFRRRLCDDDNEDESTNGRQLSSKAKVQHIHNTSNPRQTVELTEKKETVLAPTHRILPLKEDKPKEGSSLRDSILSRSFSDLIQETELLQRKDNLKQRPRLRPRSRSPSPASRRWPLASSMSPRKSTGGSVHSLEKNNASFSSIVSTPSINIEDVFESENEHAITTQLQDSPSSPVKKGRPAANLSQCSPKSKSGRSKRSIPTTPKSRRAKLERSGSAKKKNFLPTNNGLSSSCSSFDMVFDRSPRNKVSRPTENSARSMVRKRSNSARDLTKASTTHPSTMTRSGSVRNLMKESSMNRNASDTMPNRRIRVKIKKKGNQIGPTGGATYSVDSKMINDISL